MADFRLETERLILRGWSDADIPSFHAICSDPLVMATLGPSMSLDAVTDLVARMQKLQDALGHCFWAIERKSDNAMIGWCGLIRGGHGTPVSALPEIGWRLAHDSWGKGYASEAARASVGWGFDNLPDDGIWAITSRNNDRSRAVMERLGMTYLPEHDFDHPKVARDSSLLAHVTYRIARDEWNGHA